MTQLGPVALVQDLAHLPMHLNMMYEDLIVPIQFIKRESFIQGEPMFDAAIESYPETKGIILSIFYTEKFYC